VKKADAPDNLFEVKALLGQVHRIVVDLVVGQVPSHNGTAESASGLDDVTTYYTLQRYD